VAISYSILSGDVSVVKSPDETLLRVFNRVRSLMLDDANMSFAPEALTHLENNLQDLYIAYWADSNFNSTRHDITIELAFAYYQILTSLTGTCFVPINHLRD
jgi:hypothetical protein